MLLARAIKQLRDYAPVFEQRVAGTAEFAALETGKENLAVPSAFVIMTRELASEPSRAKQLNREYFAVIVCVNNQQDWRGQGGVQQIEQIKSELIRALFQWRPSCCYQHVHYAGGQFLNMDRARLWWQFEFGVDRTYTEDDGFLSLGMGDGQDAGENIADFNTVETGWDMASPRNNPQTPATPDGQIDALDTIILEQP